MDFTEAQQQFLDFAHDCVGLDGIIRKNTRVLSNRLSTAMLKSLESKGLIQWEHYGSMHPSNVDSTEVWFTADITVDPSWGI